MASTRKRGNSYTIRVSLGYDSNGKKICVSKTWKPDENLTGKKLKKELDRVAAEFEEQLKSGYKPQKSYTLERYVKEVWKSKAKKEVKPLTYNRYLKLLDRILPSIGYMKLENIQPPQIRTMLDNLVEDKREDLKYTPKKKAIDLASHCNKCKLARESGISATTILSISRGNKVMEKSAKMFAQAMGMRVERLFDRNEEPLSPATILHHFRCLSTVMTSAMQDGYIPDNPLKRVKPPKVGKQKSTYLDDNEAKVLTELVRQKAPHPFDMIIIMLIQTGMRRGECCGLTWSDIDFENNTISITKSLLYLPERGVFEDTPKNESSVRIIKVGKKLMKELQDYKQWQDALAKKVRDSGKTWENTGRVFASNTGGNINPGTVTSWFHRFVTDNDLPYGCFKARNKSDNTWFLRSPDSSGSYYVGLVSDLDDAFVVRQNDFTFGVSPAFNVDLSSVMFSTQVNDETGAYGKEYKLTLKDSNTTITPGTVTRVGNTVTVPYTVTDSTPDDDIKAERVSVVILDSNDSIKYYAPLTGSFSNNSGTFEIPGSFDRKSDRVYIFAEDVNSKYLTDYASELVPITLPDNDFSSLQDLINNAAEGDTIKLDRDYSAISAEDALEIYKTITIDLNGHTIDRGLSEGVAVSDGYVIKVEGDLTLTDSSDLQTGKITGGNFMGVGGGVCVNGAFTMTGGMISGNSASNGGGVGVFGGTFTMNGGTISGNTASWGGGVCVQVDGTFTMTGGAISDNTAEIAGGVFVYDTFTMTGGEISDNHADRGRGVYVYPDGNFYLRNGIKVLDIEGIVKRFGSVQITDPEHGAITASDRTFTVLDEEFYKEGDTVILTVTPDTGYSVTSVSLDGTALTADQDAYSFEMPAKDVTVTAEFEKLAYRISYEGVEDAENPNPAGYDVETATFTLAEPTKTGWTFTGWTYDGQTEPLNPVIIESGSTGDKIYTANWSQNDYIITKNAEHGTIISKVGDNAVDTAHYGDTVTFTVTPDTGYDLDGVSVNDGAVEVTSNTDGTYSFVMPAENVTVTAEFEKLAYRISYEGVEDAENPNPAGYDVETATFTLAEPTKTGWTFTGWTYDGQKDPVKTVTIAKGSTGDKVYTANWSQNDYTITKTAAHGTITAKVGDSEAATAHYGDTVKLTVTSDVGYAVKSVSVNDKSLSTVEGVYSFEMPDEDVTVTAVFEKLPDVTYIGEDGTEKTITGYEYSLISDGDTELEGGIYVVDGEIEINNELQLKGDTSIILKDGAKLSITTGTRQYGIKAYCDDDDNNYGLKIFGQSGSTGELIINSEDVSIAYCSYYTQYGGIVDLTSYLSALEPINDVTINGGIIKTNAYSGIYTMNSDIIINGGSVTAKGESYGIYTIGGDIAITDAIVIAEASDRFGEGLRTDNGSLTISGSTVTAKGYDDGINVGNGNITITDGKVTAESSDGAAICAMRDITVNGSEVTATGKTCGICSEAAGYTIIITDGVVKAVSSDGNGIETYNFTISGGEVTATGTEYGIKANHDLTLGGATVTANSYSIGSTGAFKIAEGMAYTDSTDFYKNTLTNEQIEAIAGKKLVPVGVYAVTISESEHGTVTADKSNAAVGETVTLTVTTDTDYFVKYVSVNGTALTAVQGKYSFEMPDKNVTVTAVIEFLPDVTYIGEDGEAHTLTGYEYSLITESDTELAGGFYVVDGEVEINNTLQLKGDTSIILKDGAKLSITNDSGDGISGRDWDAGKYYSLKIFSQSGSTGELNINSKGYAINYCKDYEQYGAVVDLTSSQGLAAYIRNDFTINGGSVTVKGNSGIRSVGNITINDCSVTLECNSYGLYSDNNIIISNAEVNVKSNSSTAIYAHSDINISNSSVTAEGSDRGLLAMFGKILISGNEVKANGGYAGIWAAENITITDGTVTAESSDKYGIQMMSGVLTVSGGTIEVTGKTNGIDCSSANIIITDGTVTAEASDGTGIRTMAMDGLNISGGTVTATGTEVGVFAHITLGGGTITANSYASINNFKIAEGMVYTDGTDFYKNTLTNEQKNAVADKTLVPADVYAVTISESEHGTVTADKSNAAVGETVTLTVTTDTDYFVKYVSVNGTALTADQGVYFFTMPAENVTVTAVFEFRPDVTYIGEDGEGHTLTGNDYNLITEGMTELAGGFYVVDGVVEINNILYLKSDTSIILKDGAKLSITNDSGNGISGYNYNLKIFGQLDGTGILNINSKFDAIYVNDITINGGSVTAKGKFSGLTAKQNINISNAEVIATSDSMAISAESNINIINSSVTAEGETMGLHTMMGDILISGSTVNAEGEDCGITTSSGNITITDGTVTAESSDRFGISALGDFTVNGGTVEAAGKIFGITVSRKIIIKGGSVTADASGGTGIFATYEITVNGGTVIATGTRGGVNSSITLGGGTITANSYFSPTFKIAEGMVYTDGTDFYQNTLTNEQKNAVADKTLVPVGVYAVTISESNNGTVKADKSYAAAGETVTLTITPTEGYDLGSLSVNGTAVDSSYIIINTDGSYTYSFIMLESDVTVSAEFDATAALDGYSLSLGGEIGLYACFIIPDEIMQQNPTMVITKTDGSTETIDSYSFVPYDSSRNSYVFGPVYVNAKEMTDTVNFTLTNGEKTFINKDTSVKEAATVYLTSTDEQYAETKPLVQAMLNYGAYSQTYFGYPSDNCVLANDFTGDEKVESFDTSVSDVTEIPFSCAVEENCPIIFYDVNLSLESEVALNMYFTYTDDERVESAVLTATEAFDENLIKIEWKEFGTNKVMIKISNIPAEYLGSDFKVLINDKYNVTYSPMSYCNRIIDSVTGSKNPDMQNLCRALYKYWQAAVTYKESQSND